MATGSSDRNERGDTAGRSFWLIGRRPQQTFSRWRALAEGPIMLEAISDHASVLNTAALARRGIF